MFIQYIRMTRIGQPNIALLFYWDDYRDAYNSQQNYTVALTPQINGGLNFRLNYTGLESSQYHIRVRKYDHNNPSSSSVSKFVFLYHVLRIYYFSDSGRAHTRTSIGVAVGNVAGVAIITALLFFSLTCGVDGARFP